MNSNISNGETFVKYQIIDKQQQGIVVGIFEHPAGWKTDGGAFWNFQNISNPVVYNAWTINPNKFEMLEFLPLESFSWTEPDMGMYSRGQNVNGLINLPPMSAVDTLTQLIIPKYRGNRQGLRIVEANAVPTTIKTSAPIPTQNVVAHKVTVNVEYLEENRMIEEEFHATHSICHFPPVSSGFGMSYFIGWGILELCSFRAEKGQLENVRETFLRVQSSFKLNPQWVEFCNKTSQMLSNTANQMANDSINAGWERLRMNGEASRQFMINNQNYIDRQQQRINESYNSPPPSTSSGSNSSESGYSSHEAYIDSIYGQESIYNSENSANEKVSGYNDYIWKDEFGNVKTTNDPNFDPNVGTHINWTLAQKKRIGD